MSPIVRIYLPLGPRQLASLERQRALPVRGARAYFVTDAERSGTPSAHDHEEELEFAALQRAAGDAAAHGWLVVAAADVDLDLLDPPRPAAGDEYSRIREPLPLRRFASLHVLDPAGDRDPDSDLELSWYDITELAQVRRLG